MPHSRLGKGYNDARAAAICTWGVLERIDEETRRLNPRFLLGGEAPAMLAGMCAAPGTGLPADLPLITHWRS